MPAAKRHCWRPLQNLTCCRACTARRASEQPLAAPRRRTGAPSDGRVGAEPTSEGWSASAANACAQPARAYRNDWAKGEAAGALPKPQALNTADYDSNCGRELRVSFHRLCDETTWLCPAWRFSGPARTAWGPGRRGDEPSAPSARARHTGAARLPPKPTGSCTAKPAATPRTAHSAGAAAHGAPIELVVCPRNAQTRSHGQNGMRGVLVERRGAEPRIPLHSQEARRGSQGRRLGTFLRQHGRRRELDDLPLRAADPV